MKLGYLKKVKRQINDYSLVCKETLWISEKVCKEKLYLNHKLMAILEIP